MATSDAVAPTSCLLADCVIKCDDRHTGFRHRYILFAAAETVRTFARVNPYIDGMFDCATCTVQFASCSNALLALHTLASYLALNFVARSEAIPMLLHAERLSSFKRFSPNTELTKVLPLHRCSIGFASLQTLYAQQIRMVRCVSNRHCHASIVRARRNDESACPPYMQRISCRVSQRVRAG